MRSASSKNKYSKNTVYKRLQPAKKQILDQSKNFEGKRGKKIENSIINQIGQIKKSKKQTICQQPLPQGVDSKTTKHQMERRINKQLKYSSLQTITMWLLKKNKIYQDSQRIAKLQKMKMHKNYLIIVFRLAFLYYKKLQQKGEKQQIVEQIFYFLFNSLQDCLLKKCKSKQGKKYPNKFIDMIRQKNTNDLKVLNKVFQSDLSDESMVEGTIIQLYRCKKNGTSSKAQEKLAKQLAQMIIEVSKNGNPPFRLSSNQQQRNQQQFSLDSSIINQILPLPKSKSQQQSDSDENKPIKIIQEQENEFDMSQDLIRDQ